MRWKGHGICVLTVGLIRSTVQNLSTTALWVALNKYGNVKWAQWVLWNSSGASDAFVIWFFEEKTADAGHCSDCSFMQREIQDSKEQVSEHYQNKKFVASAVGFRPRGRTQILDLSTHCAVSILGWMNLDIIGGHYVYLAADGVRRVIVRSVTLHTLAHCQNYDKLL